ncbi:hypothetical protein C4D60_Mb05t23230 [Musa balbisiana]|uniref:Uncharacterized protein n=1 Tax=Musa balbisiana TaxID=52838 RepID=A0A4S8JYA2_MUSBA|nr:hypothetical protein C4D60_Mb05t23230 [Musa balbisiana]
MIGQNPYPKRGFMCHVAWPHGSESPLVLRHSMKKPAPSPSSLGASPLTATLSSSHGTLN